MQQLMGSKGLGLTPASLWARTNAVEGKTPRRRICGNERYGKGASHFVSPERKSTARFHRTGTADRCIDYFDFGSDGNSRLPADNALPATLGRYARHQRS